MEAWVYILRCADGSYYTGLARGPDLARRMAEHEAGEGADYTRRRLPVELVFSQHFARIEDAIEAERRIKGWSRAKKEALIAGRFDLLPDLSARGFRPAADDADGDD
ncbi:hypothetical protein DDZ18_02260 [Marinicauda salina]|uniref:GIY-YIG domain-containing protein n=1 Tax=Marinicauda salina TaxID=2135793 RepID=A0A2U2BWQ6_9PROT|nr:GIY-YIG nuclease family protein [Marinicauda salina]PWE18451.1 hypothetical protein DDZ18_02260 [Marinicauda salina]